MEQTSLYPRTPEKYCDACSYYSALKEPRERSAGDLIPDLPEMDAAKVVTGNPQTPDLLTTVNENLGYILRDINECDKVFLYVKNAQFALSQYCRATPGNKANVSEFAVEKPYKELKTLLGYWISA